MKYDKSVIKFNEISPRGFENLCYDLLVKYNYQNLIWREGGADNGRDLEANYSFLNPINHKYTKWFFECKHYTSGGVPPSELTSKIAWADAELPNTLVIFISSYLSNNARTWLEKIALQKSYDIKIIEGEDLKDRLLMYPDLIESYFSLDRYDKMLKDLKDYKNKYSINPSYEFLKEIIQNIELIKLDNEDYGFILFNFYSQFQYFENRNDYYGDFDPKLIYRLLEHLKLTVSNDILESFTEYKDDYDELAGDGFITEMWWLKEEENEWHNMQMYDFQYYVFHLNQSKVRDKWKTGEYLFIIYNDVAFELFNVEKTEIRIIRDFNPDKLDVLSLKLNKNIREAYRKYLEALGN